MNDVSIQPPPRPTNEAGELRHVGVELEFSDLALKEAAGLIVECYGGEAVQINDYLWEVHRTRLGDFNVELDVSFLKDEVLKKNLGRAVEKVVGTLSKTVAPNEIVCPPIPFDQLGELEGLWRGLLRRGAEDTKGSLLNAFGLHLNPEVPATDVETLLSFLRAYGVLQDWLRERLEVDFSRALTPFITPFPHAYVLRIIDPSYSPDLGELIDDYLEANPSRNRGLDMLPLFVFLDEERVAKLADLEGVKGRPTFHYRLPNSRIGGDANMLIREWNRWVFVERLAEDRPRLADVMKRYTLAAAGHQESLLTPFFDTLEEAIQ